LPLTGKQKRYLRSLGHHLEPVVQIGKLGLTEGVSAAVDIALEKHELIKLRIGTECPEDRYALVERLAPGVRAEVAQVMGRTALLFRKRKKDSKIELPKEEPEKAGKKGKGKTAKVAAKPVAKPATPPEDDAEDGDLG
jgi:RNA-binding protein